MLQVCNLHCQQASLDVREFFFSQRVVKEWNLLPQDVVDATSMNQFKNRLDKFLQSMGIKSTATKRFKPTRPSLDKCK